MSYVVKRRFNVNGWPVDEIEAKCVKCGYRETALLNVMDAPFSARNPVDRNEERNWKTALDEKMEFYKNFMCARCAKEAA
jgi:Zn ribbon nucleic-acid-binding protein